MDEQEILRQAEQIINEQANVIEALQVQLKEANMNTNQQVLELQPKLKELLEMIKERYAGAYSDYASSILNLALGAIGDINQNMKYLRILEKTDLAYLTSVEQQELRGQIEIFKKKDLRFQIFCKTQDLDWERTLNIIKQETINNLQVEVSELKNQLKSLKQDSEKETINKLQAENLELNSQIKRLKQEGYLKTLKDCEKEISIIKLKVETIDREIEEKDNKLKERTELLGKLSKEEKQKEILEKIVAESVGEFKKIRE